MRTRLASLAFVTLLIPVAVNAQIYKCTGRDGRVAFQDTPCLGATGKVIEVRPSGGGVVVVPPKAAPGSQAAPAAAPAGRKDEVSPTVVAVKPPTQAQRDAAQLKAMETDRRRRAIDYDLSAAESSVESLRASMERDLADVRGRMQMVNTSVPGTLLEQNVANELQAATDRYQVQIRAAEDRVSELRKAREDLTRTSSTDRRSEASSGAKP